MHIITHFIIQIPLFFILNALFGYEAAKIIVLFHFIPSLDFVLAAIPFFRKFHRHLFHNVFVMLIACIVAGFFLNWLISLLGCLNFVLHILIDSDYGGVAIFYPFSKKKYKIQDLKKALNN